MLAQGNVKSRLPAHVCHCGALAGQGHHLEQLLKADLPELMSQGILQPALGIEQLAEQLHHLKS